MSEKSPADYLPSIALFKAFNSEQLESIEKYSRILKLNPQQTLLTQGDKNIKLYILILGKLAVRVDGSTIAMMDQMGDIIGEMSVVTGSPASATIISETPVKVMEVDIQGLNDFLGDKKEEFNEELYRAFAVILSEKLRSTNQKAKYFEEFSEKHLSEIYQGQELTLKRLQEVSNQNLTNLKAVIESMQQAPDEQKTQKALSEVEYIQKSIEPIINHFSVGPERQHKKVLLAESNKRQQSVAKMALGGTGIEIEISAFIEDAREKLNSNSYDIVFVNSEMIPLIGEFGGKKKPKFALMTSDTISQYIPELKKLDNLPNIVSRDPEDRYFTSKNIVTTVTKLASDDFFGLNKYLAWGVDLQNFEVTGSSMRKDLNETMKNYFTDLGVRESRLGPVCTVAEELLMNAIYDAPTDDDGQAIYNHLDRNIPVELTKEQYGQFSYGTDGMFIGISVEDPFGALNGQLVMDYLESCYGGNAGSLNQKKGGAGRGLHMIVEMSDLVVFNIHPQVKTEVISLFHIDSKASVDRAASFHYFCEGV